MKLAGRATLALVLVLTAAAASAGPLDTRHQDHRDTLKLAVEPVWDAVLGATPEGTARAFLADQAGRFGLDPTLADLRLVEARESLLAHHFRFAQRLNDLPVQGGEVVVSVAKDDGRVLRAYNAYYPVGEQARFLPTAGLDREAAFDAAWQRLRAHGDLRSLPSAELMYTPEGEGFRLNWLVTLDLTGPDGAWQARVDALSGAVVALDDIRAVRKPLAETAAERIAAHEGPLADRQDAFAAIARLEAEREERLARAALSRASGTGVVFDPDPRTTLRDNYLRDNASPSAFNDAYFVRDLLDIEHTGGLYYLNGPWVNILDWDPPSTAPSTTTDGDWDRQRGVNSFNDAMTYFHLDQNQRYIQSLGFVGSTGIQEGSISADTDGVNGAGQLLLRAGGEPSLLRPRLRRRQRGRRRDPARVRPRHPSQHQLELVRRRHRRHRRGLRRLLGRQLQLRHQNGPIFYPDWIFHWDGHGAGNWCWPGRVMNATHLQYVHSQNYSAHQSIPGGISDELWSTPIFQALRTLVEEHGETRESADTVILESQFGQGSGLKMRDMANAIVATAQALYPGGPHAEVYVEKFLVHNIILAPAPAVGVVAFEIVDEPSGNGAADPGETVDVRVTLSNNGLSAATGVSAVLSAATPA